MSENNEYDMRNFFLKYFSRFLAVLGCSTLVTACYGVPYDDFHAAVSGTVLDAETGEPIRGISVRMTPGSRTLSNGNPVQSLSPCGSTREELTSVNGAFDGYVSGYGEPDGILVECMDIDGEANGSYLPKSQIVSLSEADDIEITMESIR